nr:MAG TPA: hypothetical protein [Caudoviricetes sp.]
MPEFYVRQLHIVNVLSVIRSVSTYVFTLSLLITS